MSITVTKAVTQEQTPVFFKEPATAAPILPIIKPVNINPVNKGSNALSLERQYTVQTESLVHHLVIDIKRSNASAITIDHPTFKSFFSDSDEAYLGKHMNALGVTIFIENGPDSDDDEPEVEERTPVATSPVITSRVTDSGAAMDTAINKIKEDVLAKKGISIDLRSYGIDAASLPGAKLDELTNFCNINGIFLMY